MKRVFSAGGIVFNQQGQVLLTQNSSNKYWGFPKGTINLEKKESMKAAATREVKEEGGVEAEIIDKIGDTKYIFTQPETKEKFFKIVSYYAMKYISGDPKDHDWEVSEAGWFEPEEALKKLSFSGDKEMLKKALEIMGTLASI